MGVKEMPEDIWVGQFHSLRPFPLLFSSYLHAVFVPSSWYYQVSVKGARKRFGEEYACFHVWPALGKRRFSHEVCKALTSAQSSIIRMALFARCSIVHEKECGTMKKINRRAKRTQKAKEIDTSTLKTNECIAIRTLLTISPQQSHSRDTPNKYQQKRSSTHLFWRQYAYHNHYHQWYGGEV